MCTSNNGISRIMLIQGAKKTNILACWYNHNRTGAMNKRIKTLFSNWFTAAVRVWNAHTLQKFYSDNTTKACHSCGVKNEQVQKLIWLYVSIGRSIYWTDVICNHRMLRHGIALRFRFGEESVRTSRLWSSGKRVVYAVLERPDKICTLMKEIACQAKENLIISCPRHGEVSELAEGARLEIVCTRKVPGVRISPSPPEKSRVLL